MLEKMLGHYYLRCGGMCNVRCYYMASNALRKIRKELKHVKSKSEIKVLVDELDAEWQKDERTMREEDWVLLVRILWKTHERLANEH